MLVRCLQYFLVLILLVPSIQAQFRAGIQGLVTDPTGAAIANAKVILTSRETNPTREAASNEIGFYSFDRLAPGRYSVSAEAQGFKKRVVEDVAVTGEQTAGLNLGLEVGT